jgi:hypothetical protein
MTISLAAALRFIRALKDLTLVQRLHSTLRKNRRKTVMSQRNFGVLVREEQKKAWRKLAV